MNLKEGFPVYVPSMIFLDFPSNSSDFFLGKIGANTGKILLLRPYDFTMGNGPKVSNYHNHGLWMCM